MPQGATPPRILRFGVFELDLDAKELRKRGAKAKVQDQPLDILIMLVERPGDVVTREEIRNRLWPADTFVEFDQSIGTAVRKLRAVLSDNAETPHVIETVPRRGYRFLLPVTAAGATEANPRRSTWRSRAHWRIWTLAAAVSAIAALAFVLTTAQRRATPERTLKRITFDDGLQFGATWSPDGRFFAYSANRGGNFDIWVQRAGAIDAVKITSGPGHNWQPDWSPAEDLIVFRSERDGGGIFVVPAHGGPEKRIATFGYHPRWSPDGRQILIDSTYFPWMWNKLYLAGVDGGAPREILIEALLKLRLGERTADWSPDGKRISFWGASDRGVEFWTVPLAGGEAKRSDIASDVSRQLKNMLFQYSSAGSVADFRWDPSGRAIYFVGQSSGVWNLWKVSVDPVSLRWTALERLTTGPGAHTDLAISRDGKFLAFTPRPSQVRIWLWPFSANEGRVVGAGEPVTSAGMDAWMPALSPDGKKVAFAAMRAGKWELWEKSLEGGKETLLSNDGRSLAPQWSPDGKRIHLSTESTYAGTTTLMEDGGGVEQRISIPSSCDCITEDWSPDQKSLIGEGWDRSRGVRGRFMLFLLDLPTGAMRESVLRQITDSHTDALYEPRISPDSKWIVFEVVKGGAVAGAGAENPTISVVPISGGEWIPIAGGNSWNDKPRWSPDGRTIYYLSTRNGMLNLWGVHFNPLTGKPSEPPFQVTHFGEAVPMMIADRDIGLAEISLSGKSLALPMTEASGSIWMLDNIDR